MFNSIYESVINLVSVISALITAYIIYLRSKRNYEAKIAEHTENLKKENSDIKIKLSIFNKLSYLMAVNDIKQVVNEIFKNTIADRFTIFIAVNGIRDFGVVSVIYEQEKIDDSINAIYRYKNVNIDEAYKTLLKSVEMVGPLYLQTTLMEEQMLKTFYEDEGVKFSMIRFIFRGKIDDENDYIIYSSMSTTKDRNFTKKDRNFIISRYDSTINPKILSVIND